MQKNVTTNNSKDGMCPECAIIAKEIHMAVKITARSM